MKAVTFDEQNKIYKADGCFDLPAYNDGQQTITKWQFSPDELKQLTENGGHIYLSVFAGPSTPPVAVMVETPFFKVKHNDAFCDIAYFPTITTAAVTKPITVWNGIDAPAPKYLQIDGRQYVRDLSSKPRRTMNPILPAGSYYIRATQEGEERDQIGADTALVRIEIPGTLEGLIPIPEQVNPAHN